MKKTHLSSMQQPSMLVRDSAVRPVSLPLAPAAPVYVGMTASRVSEFMSARESRAPCEASFLATASPIPEAAPVMATSSLENGPIDVLVHKAVAGASAQ